MSPKSLFFLVAVGLCATQMVSANREAGGMANLMNIATAKLTSYLTDAESPIRSSINTVKNYIVDLENRFLESGTKALNKAGINVDLKDVANLVKGKINVCANNDNIKSGAVAILDNMATCITKDVASLKNLVTEMDDLWVTAQNMPKAITDITARCQSDKPVAEEPLKLTLDTSNHELAAASNELLQTASKHVSKRALGGLMRMARCAKSVFDFAKSDLVVGIPGDVMSAATSAFQIMKSVQGGIPACVALKATENVSEIAKLGLQVQSCMATGLTDAEINNNPSLKALKQLSNAAVTLSKLQSGGAMKAAAHILG